MVLVGNNLSALDMERYLKTHSGTEKNILFGFQITAGKPEAQYAICERMGVSGMDIGFLRGAVPGQLKQTMERLVHNTGYRPRWHDDMESFFKCHVAVILPLGYLAYSADCDYRKTTKEQRRLCMDASIEGYDLLLKLGYSIVPKGDDA